MEKSIKEIAWKCFENGLSFMVFSESHSVEVGYHTEDEYIKVSGAFLTKEYAKFENPVQALERVSREIDQFLKEEKAVV